MRRLASVLVVVLVAGVGWGEEEPRPAGVDPFFVRRLVTDETNPAPPARLSVPTATFVLDVRGSRFERSLLGFPGQPQIAEWPDLDVTAEVTLGRDVDGIVGVSYRAEWREGKVAEHIIAPSGYTAGERPEFDLHTTVRTRVSGSVRLGGAEEEIAQFPMRAGGEAAVARLSLRVSPSRPGNAGPPAIERIVCRLLRLPEGKGVPGWGGLDPNEAYVRLREVGAVVLRSFRVARTPGAALGLSTMVERDYRRDFDVTVGCVARIGPPILGTACVGFSARVSGDSGLAWEWSGIRLWDWFTTSLANTGPITIDLPEIAVARGEAPLADGLTLHPVADLEGGGKLALLVGRE